MERERRVVLVVEDDLFVLAVTCSALERAGYETLSATSPEEALAAATTRKLAAAVVDVVLPGGDGRALLEELRASRPQLATVLVSGHIRAPDDSQLGVFLAKPFTPTQLLAALDGQLEG